MATYGIRMVTPSGEKITCNSGLTKEDAERLVDLYPAIEGFTTEVFNTERLYEVGIRHKRTGEEFTVEVWGASPEDATSKLLNSLIGADKQYTWICTWSNTQE